MYNMNISIFGFTFRLEVLLIIVLLWWIMWGHVLCSCSRGNSLLEDFSNINKASFDYTMKNFKEGFSQIKTNGPNTNSWFTPKLTYTKGDTPNKAVQSILNRKQQQLPLPEGQLDFLASVPFKPECCPNAYSNSSGCACMTAKDYNYLINRGGNNVPYSEY